MRLLGPNEMSRRMFLELGAGALLDPLLAQGANTNRSSESLAIPNGKPLLRVVIGDDRARIPFLSWDTEGGRRGEVNLLRPESGITIRTFSRGKWQEGTSLQRHHDISNQARTRFRLRAADHVTLSWDIVIGLDRLTLGFSVQGGRAGEIEKIELTFPFDPRVTPTTILPSAWWADGTFRLPAIISAPDFGQMLLSVSGSSDVKGRLEGSREHQTVVLILELAAPRPEGECTVVLAPVQLSCPQGLEDEDYWQAVRRGWFNVWQPSSRWGEQNRPYSAPAGVLANNVVSDPVSFALPFYADLALWTPNLAPGISAASLVRQTTDWWLEHRTGSSGAVVGYWDYTTFLDANAGPLIAAWDYVEATRDLEWLSPRIGRLEFVAEYLAKRDVDGDGMVEALQSGNQKTLREPARSCCWWDALNCGGKDGYSNAMIYRAWCCLADLEEKLGRTVQQAHYVQLADRLRAVYAKTLFNPRTGWLAGWKSADGELHDYASHVVNGMAVEYGLVETEAGRKILARLWKKIQTAGFTRFDLGLPSTLVPVHRSDYLQPDSIGLPTLEDGTDTFGQYMNGGISAGHCLHFLAAHYVVGEAVKADHVLNAMLARQAKGMFQNGVRNYPGKGIDWTSWDGGPCGYEGYLADVFFFLQTGLLREPKFRTRYYRPLTSAQGAPKNAAL